jgi:2-polyprenyl-3-methyl-5-hydroxy-6-metoxy-1,4-benzoquinol methylase
MEMKIQEDEVKSYFKVNAEEFDEIYENKGNFVKTISNKFFRGGMKERFDLTIDSCIELKNRKKSKTILDIGCGAGRFAYPLEKSGFEIFGIDYSSEMIELANSYLNNYKREMKKDPKIKFEVSDFMKDFSIKNSYDVSIALGVFDYIKTPSPFIKKMKSVTNELMILSFPKKLTPQMPMRKLWLLLKKCPVYFYTKKEVKQILEESEIYNYSIKEVQAGYQVTADISITNSI